MQSDSQEYITIKVSEEISLIQLNFSDALEYINAIDNDRNYLRVWLPFVDFAHSSVDIDRFIAALGLVTKENREFDFAIRYNGAFAGSIGIKCPLDSNRKSEIWYWLDKEYRKMGIAINSTRALIKYAFEELNVNRIQIKCAVGNISSKNIPIKLGFVLEGIERDGEFLLDGKFTDLEVYSKLKNDL